MTIVFAKGRASIIRSAGSGASAGLGRLHLVVFYRFRHEQPSASAPAARRAPAAGTHENREHVRGRVDRGRPLKCRAFDQLRPRRRVVANVRGQQANSLRFTAGFIGRDSMMQPCHAGALLQIEPKKSIENFCSHTFSSGAAESDVKEGSSTGKTLPARNGSGGKKVPRFSCPNGVVSRISAAMPSQSKFEHRTGDDRDTKGLLQMAFMLKTNAISCAAKALRATTGRWPHSCFALQGGMQFEARILLGGEGIAGSESGQGRCFNITTSSVRCRVTVLMPSSPPGAGAACLRLL